MATGTLQRLKHFTSVVERDFDNVGYFKENSTIVGDLTTSLNASVPALHFVASPLLGLGCHTAPTLLGFIHGAGPFEVGNIIGDLDKPINVIVPAFHVVVILRSQALDSPKNGLWSRSGCCINELSFSDLLHMSQGGATLGGVASFATIEAHQNQRT
ncbi:hypothetical protein CEK25_012178 [Fusarium fujikuroi]|nr:hypothetical protein CEK25_012178 [Fusarium fujikuroi]